MKKGLPETTAIAFDKSGTLWATQRALVPNGGEVVKVRGGPHKWWRHPRHFWLPD